MQNNCTVLSTNLTQNSQEFAPCYGIVRKSKGLWAPLLAFRRALRAGVLGITEAVSQRLDQQVDSQHNQRHQHYLAECLRAHNPV
jgi:hypothetical protein